MQYYANELLPLKDEKIVQKVMSWLSKCIKDFENATVIDQEIGRFPKFHSHFFPGKLSAAKQAPHKFPFWFHFNRHTYIFILGSYKYMMRGSTSFPNVYMAGDWIINRHGSWSQVKGSRTISFKS